MIGIVLCVHHHELVAGNVDTLTLRIEKHVVRKFSGGQGSNDFTGVRVKDHKSRRLTTDNEKSAMDLVYGHRCVSVDFAQRPGRRHRPFLRVAHWDETSVSEVDK